jgi:hypothetical protein
VSDQTGAFVYRSGDGTGDVNWSDVQLRWNYRDDGVDDNALVDVQVFAIEMVQVPESDFSLGTGFNGTEIDEFYTLAQIGPFFLRQPYRVTSEAAITISNVAGSLYYDSSGTGNCNYTPTNGATNGPQRCGIFAASALLNNREETGGSYYGIMELTGNLYERAVSAGDPQGRSFTGLHGDGQVSTSGAANVANWPLDTGEGIGYRGGSYTNDTPFVFVSDRNDAANSFSGSNSRIGFRGVRTAE